MLKYKFRKIIQVSCVMCITTSMLLGCTQAQESVNRETEVEYGNLIVGKTESGAVDIGTVEQTFELDLSGLQRAELSNSTSGVSTMPGGGMNGGMNSGMDMFSQVFNMAGGGTAVVSESNANLVIKEVCVTVGEEVKAGDTLYILGEEGVSDLTNELESNVSKAKADLEAVIAEQNLSKTTAQYTYETNIAYGEYAQIEKESAIAKLEETVKEKTEALAEAQEALASYKEQLEQVTIDYEKAYEAQKNMEWSRDNTNKNNNLHNYTIYAQNATETKKLADSLEQEKEQLENRIEQAQENVSLCAKQLLQAKRDLETGMLSAQETYELRMLAYTSAQETYDVTMAYLEDELKEQQEIYEETSEKWEEFTSHIEGTVIQAKYDGVITSVGLSEGESLTTGATIVTLYDTDAVSMTVELDEEDMTDIALGSKANISFIAYPGKVFEATVSEISDASTDTSGNVTYEVTATILGNSDGLFQGMTGMITFITKEVNEVLCVSNRAIIREGKKFYVKVKDANGAVRTVEVKTGFSDGTNVEILEGLEAGTIVLIESKVGEQ